jgi:hypothetical protein
LAHVFYPVITNDKLAWQNPYAGKNVNALDGVFMYVVDVDYLFQLGKFVEFLFLFPVELFLLGVGILGTDRGIRHDGAFDIVNGIINTIAKVHRLPPLFEFAFVKTKPQRTRRSI